MFEKNKARKREKLFIPQHCNSISRVGKLHIFHSPFPQNTDRFKLRRAGFIIQNGKAKSLPPWLSYHRIQRIRVGYLGEEMFQKVKLAK